MLCRFSCAKLLSFLTFGLFFANAVVFDCGDFAGDYDLYACNLATVIEAGDTLKEVRGTHLPGRSNVEVEQLSIRDQNMPQIPKGIEKFFSKSGTPLYFQYWFNESFCRGIEIS